MAGETSREYSRARWHRSSHRRCSPSRLANARRLQAPTARAWQAAATARRRKPAVPPDRVRCPGPAGCSARRNRRSRLASGPQVAERSGFGLASTSSMPPPPTAASACADASRPMPPPEPVRAEARARCENPARERHTLGEAAPFRDVGLNDLQHVRGKRSVETRVACEIFAGRQRNAGAIAQRTATPTTAGRRAAALPASRCRTAPAPRAMSSACRATMPGSRRPSDRRRPPMRCAARRRSPDRAPCRSRSSA